MRMDRTLIASSLILFFALNTGAQAQVTTVQRTEDSQGNQVVVRSGQPAPHHYGARPSFAQLDRNHDGFITRDEAEAFTPLLNDFDNVTHGDRISPRQYAGWDYR